MRISVIIPVYNEESTIDQLQKSLAPIKNDCEIIFVDGGSVDQTISMIATEFTVLHSPKGRANQMNFGAEKSTGDILFFLHADSEIPVTALAEIEAVMNDHQAGCFGISFNSSHILMKCCQYMSNRRVKDHRIIFGDQGIFIERKLFFDLGMFPQLPIMEDYQFSLNMKARKITIGITEHRILTSDRRFSGSSLKKLQVMWLMNQLRRMYRKGIKIGNISLRYRDLR